MRFAPTDDQVEFRAAVSSLLDDVCPPAAVRAAWGGALDEDLGEGGRSVGRVQAAWAALADMGVLGLMVPEEHGGLGMRDDDLVGLVVECGRAGLPDPVVDTAGVAAAALRDARGSGSTADELADGWLSRIASGEVAVVVGFGPTPLVASATSADAFLMCGTDPVVAGSAGTGPPDAELHLVPRSSVELESAGSVDGARGLARVSWEPHPSTSLGGGSSTPDRAATAFDRAAVLDAATLVGLSQRMLDMTVDYVGERRQFGVPVGSFQAVKHRLADAALAVEFAQPLVVRAAHALSLGEPSAVPASMAKARASSAAQRMAEAALQCHGAIGYTVEHDLHLFMKRAWAISRTHGDASWHRRRVRASLLGS